MSIALQLHHLGGHEARGVRAVPAAAPPAAENAAREARREEARGGTTRHALVDALASAMRDLLPATDAAPASTEIGADPVLASAAERARDSEVQQALHRFAHELFSLLRPTGDSAPGHGHGRGHAWGRTGADALAGRLEALVQRLQAAAEPPTSASGETTVPIGTNSPAPAGTAGAAELPPASEASAAADDVVAPITAPPPARTSSAELAPLLAAFERLAAAAAADEGTAGTTAGSTERLVSFLQSVASAIRNGSGGDVRATGGLLDVVG